MTGCPCDRCRSTPPRMDCEWCDDGWIGSAECSNCDGPENTATPTDRYPSVTDCNYCDGGFVAVNGWVQPCPKCGSPKRSPTDGYPSVTDEP